MIKILSILAIIFLLVNVCESKETRQFGGSYDQNIQYNMAGSGVGYSRNGFGSAYGSYGSISPYSFGRRRRFLKKFMKKMIRYKFNKKIRN
jgi:hypothetical protein